MKPIKAFKFTQHALFVGGVVGGLALASYIIMLIWNAVLVPAMGLNSVSYGLAVKGLLGIVGIIGILSGVKQLVDFIMVRISFSIAQKRIKKMVDAQKELMKHFKMFTGGDEEHE